MLKRLAPLPPGVGDALRAQAKATANGAYTAATAAGVPAVVAKRVAAAAYDVVYFHSPAPVPSAEVRAVAKLTIGKTYAAEGHGFVGHLVSLEGAWATLERPDGATLNDWASRLYEEPLRPSLVPRRWREAPTVGMEPDRLIPPPTPEVSPNV